MMRLTAFLLLLSSSHHVAAFSVLPSTRHSPSALRMSTTTDAPIVLSGQNIELTPALSEHVNMRIGGTLAKLASHGAVRDCEVILSVNKNPKVKNGHRVEVVTNLKGTTIVCKTESSDMYGSIDLANHALNRKLRKYKERRMEGRHGGANMGDDLAAAFDALEAVEEEPESSSDDEGFEDDGKPGVIKVKSFQLDKPISLEEAVFALDYVDHDFYVFRNEETDQISVVYKRHTGGVGLVEP